MTTSSSRALATTVSKPRRKPPEAPRRYYRCRGARPCRGSQVAAQEIEEGVLRWLVHPPPELPEDLGTVLARLAPSWDLMWPINRRRLLEEIVQEVRWDGPGGEFGIRFVEEVISTLLQRFRPPPGR